MNLYLKNGYLDIKSIAESAEKNKCAFIVIIGARQVGKTYGVLNHMLSNEKKFILMRRTKEETDFISSPENSPFKALKDYDVAIKKGGKNHKTIVVNEEYRGAIMGLSTVANIRGFSGTDITDVVFDEFIPEVHIRYFKNEGDAFLNAYTTINGAREEQGLPPLRCWLLANANTLDNPILSALNISTDFEKMINKGQEYSILSKRGIMIIKPSSVVITSRRSKNALYRAIGTESKFSKMSLDNSFAYNDFTDIRHVNIKSYKPYLLIGDMMIYKDRGGESLHVVNYAGQKIRNDRIYGDTEKEIKRVNSDFIYMHSAYTLGRVTFDSYEHKCKFRAVFNC